MGYSSWSKQKWVSLAPRERKALLRKYLNYIKGKKVAHDGIRDAVGHEPCWRHIDCHEAFARGQLAEVEVQIAYTKRRRRRY